MKYQLKNSFVSLKGTAIGSLKFFFDATHIVEKILWVSMGILGTVFMSFFVASQVDSWGSNPILPTRKWIDLSKVDFPAITFCHQGNTRMAFVERMIQAADERSPKMKTLRNLFLKNSVEHMIKEWSDEYINNPEDLSIAYHFYNCASKLLDSGKWCKLLNFGFGYAKNHNISVKQVYDNIYSHLMTYDDISTGLTKIGNTMEKSSSLYNISEFLDSKSNEWLFLEKITVLLGEVPSKSLKMPIGVGRSLMELVDYNKQWNEANINELFDMFKLVNNDLNLVVISHLYTLNDFGQLTESDAFLPWKKKLYLGGIPKDFQHCFEQMFIKYYGNEDNRTIESFEETQQAQFSMKPSPCSNVSEQNPCQTYCKWHESFFDWNSIRKEEFLVIMRYSLPQRKLKLLAMDEDEKNLTKKVFGAIGEALNKTEEFFAPMPLVKLCKDQSYQKWLGDDIGMIPKFCNDFYSTPTDQGLCQTKNINIHNLIEISRNFKESFEANNDKKPLKIGTDRLKAKATFVINTNAKNLPIKTFPRVPYHEDSPFRTRKKKIKEVKFQIHATNELPQILKDSSLGIKRDSVLLEAGNEYTIVVKPFVQTVTDEFKQLGHEQRNCLLSDESPDFSALKLYTEPNCRYECKVHYAIDKCDCLPWDFPLNTSNHAMECDIFGRTCFMNAIKHFMTTEKKCPKCKDACEFMQFEKTKVIKQELDLQKLYSWSYSYDNSCYPKDICEYLNDVNDTIEPKTWYEELTDDKIKSKFDKPKIKHAKTLLSDHIIVHVIFDSAQVEVNVLDARYSIFTQIANLGGTLGLFVQITGASILTLIHLIVLIIKALCGCFTTTEVTTETEVTREEVTTEVTISQIPISSQT